MKVKSKLLTLAVAGAFAAPLAMAQGGQSGQQSAQRGNPSDWYVISIVPVEAQLVGEQRRESLFRQLDTNSNGSISPDEAGINTQLNSAFRQLDSNGNGMIDRQEFTSVHVSERSQGAQRQQQRSQSAQSQQRMQSAQRDDQSASSGGTSGRAMDQGQDRSVPYVPEAIPDSPSSGGMPRPGENWNPTNPRGQ